MATHAFCEKTHANYDYFICEEVNDWHITLSIILLLLTIIVFILVLLTWMIIYNYSYFNSIRFRCPSSIITWCILTEIYLISRILYCGLLLKWWSFSIELDIFIYIIRGFGLNGGIIIYIIRAWMYYVTYKYDQDLLNNFISTNKSWLFSNKKYKNSIANEKWLLIAGIITVFILTTILGITRAFNLNFFSNIYYGISFFLSIWILILVYKFAHDQLGIRIEYNSFFIIYIFGFIGTVLITSTLKNTSRRVLSWFGGLVLLFAGNAFTVYFPFIRGGLLKIIKKGKDYSCTKQQQLENHKELALILSNKRTYEAFRTFLASIFCVENIDFFVVVGQYRAALKQIELKKYEEENGGGFGIGPRHSRNGTTSMFEKVLNPVVKKIAETSMFSKNNKTKTENIEQRETANSITLTVDKKECINGYMGVKSISISASPEPPIQSINGLMNNHKGHSPTLSSIINNPSGSIQKQMNDEQFRLALGSISSNQSNQSNESNGSNHNKEINQMIDELVIIDDDNNDNDKEKTAKEYNLTIHIDPIKKVIESGKEMINDLKHQKNADDMIKNLVIDKNGKKIIEIKSLKFEYLEYNDKLKELDINKWSHWIYDEYISNKADYVINISYGTRLYIQQHFESDKYLPAPKKSMSNIEAPIPSDINNNGDCDIFDIAINEVWKLMANDSLTHFRRSTNYKQLLSFFQTVAPDIDATPRFNMNIGGATFKKSFVE